MSGSGIRSCGRPRIERRRPTSGAGRTKHSRRRPIRSDIPTAEPGTSRTRQPAPTRAWPPSSSDRLQGRGPAVAWRRPPRSSSAPPSSARIPPQRGTRALAAAQLKLDAGALEVAERLLTVAAASPLEELDSARAGRLRAQVAFARTPGWDTPSLLSAAAKRLEPLDPELARETHLEALWAALRSGTCRQQTGRGGCPGGDAPPRAGARDRPAAGRRPRANDARLRAGVAGGQACSCRLPGRGIPSREPRVVLALLSTRDGLLGRRRLRCDLQRVWVASHARAAA